MQHSNHVEYALTHEPIRLVISTQVSWVMLTERHLQIFVAIADERHFGDAARVVGITQPPLSQGLRRLETLVGAKLFERGPGQVELTPAGAALLPFARRALRLIRRVPPSRQSSKTPTARNCGSG